MLAAIILGIIAVLAVIVYMTINSPSLKSRNESYLQEMSRFWGGECNPIPEAENSFRVTFKFRGYDCSFEEVEVPGLRGPTQIGYLKMNTGGRLTLSFTERSRTQIRSNAKSFEDVANSMWGSTGDQVQLPKDLQEFNAHTNNIALSNTLINHPAVTRIFLSYKQRDSRGHPVMSLQVRDGVIVLEFHPPGEVEPSILTLQQNVTTSESYLKEFLAISEVLKGLEAEGQ